MLREHRGPTRRLVGKKMGLNTKQSFEHGAGVLNSYSSNEVVVVQSLSRVQLFVTPWTAVLQASLSFVMSWSLLKLMSAESVMPSIYLILCLPLSSCLRAFPPSESFLMSRLFTSCGSIRASASASVLLMNIQDLFPLGLTGLVSLQSKGLSRVFSNTTVQKHQFFSIHHLLWSNSHIHI